MSQLLYPIIIILLITINSGCIIINYETNIIRTHSVYKTLDKESVHLIESIIKEANKRERKDYYFKKLKELLDTPEQPSVANNIMNEQKVMQSFREVKMERKYISYHGINLSEYLNIEELYELNSPYIWRRYCPSWNKPCFYVTSQNVNDILVHINVKIKGNDNVIKRIVDMEDAIEKHISKPGFSVNLVLVNNLKTKDVFEVEADMTSWPTNYNWSGGYKILAHELMHLMGLPDEYDRIESHANNKNMAIKQRLYQFKLQMDDNIPVDAKDGIMCHHWLKPLERHVCFAVGLGKDCVKKRTKNFNK